MKKENITNITVNSIKDIPKGKTDWERTDAITEAEAYQNAEKDPDAQPLSLKKSLEQTIDIKLIRSKLSMTQEQFANTFHLSLPTLRDWEQNRVRPDQAARTLLRVIERNPEAVKIALKSA
jgi:putative transcriptional regulator